MSVTVLARHDLHRRLHLPISTVAMMKAESERALGVAEGPTAAARVLERTEPGTLFLLEQGDEPGTEAHAYRAVLACPACGMLGLMTGAQYVGQVAMMCASEGCSAEYRLAGGQIHFRAVQ